MMNLQMARDLIIKRDKILINGLLLLTCIEWFSLDAHGRFRNRSTSM